MHEFDLLPDDILPAATPAAAHAKGATPIADARPDLPIPAETRWLCGELARQARDFYPDRDWHGVAPIVERIWMREPRGIDWSTAAPLIHAAWQGA